MARTIQTDGITVINETDRRGQRILDLIKQYIPGFVGHYYGFRTIGDNQISFPAIFVEPVSQTPKMVSTGKYFITWSYNIYFYVVDNNPEDVTTLISSGAEALVKLFSNNALGTLSNEFKADNGFWLDSEFKSVELSSTFINAVPNDLSGQQYMRAGVARFIIEDQLLI